MTGTYCSIALETAMVFLRCARKPAKRVLQCRRYQTRKNRGSIVSEQFVSSFVWRNPTRIVYGIGKLGSIADEVRGVAGVGASVFLVTGRSFLRERGILQNVLDDLADFSVTLHDRANPFPSPDDADAAAEHCRESGADVVVAIGGGSALDLAKAAAILATQDGASRNYMSGGADFENAGLPFIAVPTTSGSSSEVTSGSALWDWDAKDHFGLSSADDVPGRGDSGPATRHDHEPEPRGEYGHGRFHKRVRELLERERRACVGRAGAGSDTDIFAEPRALGDTG